MEFSEAKNKIKLNDLDPVTKLTRFTARLGIKMKRRQLEKDKKFLEARWVPEELDDGEVLNFTVSTLVEQFYNRLLGNKAGDSFYAKRHRASESSTSVVINTSKRFSTKYRTGKRVSYSKQKSAHFQEVESPTERTTRFHSELSIADQDDQSALAAAIPVEKQQKLEYGYELLHLDAATVNLTQQKVNFINQTLDGFREASRDPNLVNDLLGVLLTIRILIKSPHHVDELLPIRPTIVKLLKFGLQKGLSGVIIYICLFVIDKLMKSNYRFTSTKIPGLDGLVHLSMKRFENLCSIQVTSCVILWKLSNIEDLKQQMLQSDTLKLVLRAMKTFRKSNRLQYEGCALLQSLSVNDTNEDKIRQGDAFDILLGVANSEEMMAYVVLRACIALWNLSFQDANKRDLVHKKAHHTLVRIINRHSVAGVSNPDIVAEACGVVWNLADWMPGKSEMIQYRIPEIIVDTMKKFKMIAKVQKMGCGCLRSLAHDDQSRISLMQIGAAEKILESMRDHVTNQSIQYQAFAVLKKLSCNDVNEGRLIRMSAGERILEAMEFHKLVPSIQERACGVLWNLAVNDDHKIKLVQIGCAEKMLQAMELHLKNEGVQYQTCRTLKRLARDPHNEHRLMSLGAAKHVLKAMKTHIKSENIQEKGCGVLWNLSDRDEHKTILMNYGAARQILESMAAHLTNENVQYEACGALKRLAVDDEIEMQLMDMNAASYVLRAMAQHVGNSDVQSQACGVLWNLAFNGQLKLMELDAASQIFIAMRRHPTNVSVQEKACGTLWKLAEVEENNEKLIKAGVIPKVLEAMDNNQGHPGVQYQACGTLWNLAVKENNREELLNHSVEDRVLVAMNVHRQRPDILHSACGVLYNLAQSNIPLIRLTTPHAAGNTAGKLLSMLKEMGTKSGMRTQTKDKTSFVSNRLLLASKGAVLNIVQCMRTHAANVDVVYQAMAALNFLAHEPKNMVHFTSHKSIFSDVLSVMQIHEEDVGIQENACYLLSYVAEFSSLQGLGLEKFHKRQQVDRLVPKPTTKEWPLSLPVLRKAISVVLNSMSKYLLRPMIQHRGLLFLTLAYKELVKHEARLLESLKNSEETPYDHSQAAAFVDDDWKSVSSSTLSLPRSMLTEDARYTLRKLVSVTEEEGFAEDISMNLVRRTELAMSNHPREAKIQLLGHRFVREIMHTADKYDFVPFCMEMKYSLMANKEALISRICANFVQFDSLKLKHEACWCIRLLVGFDQEVATLLFHHGFHSALLDQLKQLKGNPKFLSVGLITLLLMISHPSVTSLADIDIEATDLASLLIDVCQHLAESVAMRDRSMLNPLLSLCYVIATVCQDFEDFCVEYVNQNGLAIVVDMLRMCGDLEAPQRSVVISIVASVAQHRSALVASNEKTSLKRILSCLNALFSQALGGIAERTQMKVAGSSSFLVQKSHQNISYPSGGLKEVTMPMKNGGLSERETKAQPYSADQQQYTLCQGSHAILEQVCMIYGQVAMHSPVAAAFLCGEKGVMENLRHLCSLKHRRAKVSRGRYNDMTKLSELALNTLKIIEEHGIPRARPASMDSKVSI